MVAYPARDAACKRHTGLFAGPGSGFASSLWQAPGSGSKAQCPENSDQPAHEAARHSPPAHSRLAYDGWYASAPGSLALQAQQRLLRKMLAPWAGSGEGRREPSLLELFCGSGFFLAQCCRDGFNVSGQEHDLALVQSARSRLGRKAEIIQNNPEQLPFNDQSFDYVICVNGLEFARDARAILREALRLAIQGMLIAFPNSWSLRGVETLGKKYPQGAEVHHVPYGAHKKFAPVTIWNLLHKLEVRASLTWRSTLLGPGCTWKDNPFCKRLNTLALPIASGSSVMLRLDFAPSLAGTPLLLSGWRE
jgi:SAM-dependent methyltransferase